VDLLEIEKKLSIWEFRSLPHALIFPSKLKGHVNAPKFLKVLWYINYFKF